MLFLICCCCLWLIVNVSGLSPALALGRHTARSGTCIFLVTVGAGAVAEVGAEVEVDVRLCASKVQVRSN